MCAPVRQNFIISTRASEQEEREEENESDVTETSSSRHIPRRVRHARRSTYLPSHFGYAKWRKAFCGTHANVRPKIFSRFIFGTKVHMCGGV